MGTEIVFMVKASWICHLKKLYVNIIFAGVSVAFCDRSARREESLETTYIQLARLGEGKFTVD